ncbi:MAG: FadR/GntR family transcriptional regulator [Leucobacter sp.]
MKAHEAVMAWVTDELSSGRLRIGDRLPSERALAETLGVSRASLREALRVLEALGTIRSATGSGPKSGTVITAAPEQALSLALNLQLATNHVEHRHVAETRALLETWAASHSDPALGDWETAAHLLDLMDDPELPIEHFLAHDAQFHVTLSRAAGNPLISALMEALRLSIAEHTAARARALPAWRTTADRLRAEHREILDALRRGDRDAGAELLRAHIDGYYRETET